MKHSRVNASGVLLVEGDEDKVFFEKLCESLDLAEYLRIELCGGKSKFRPTLKGLLPELMAEESSIHTLGIVRDADDSLHNTFKSVQGALKDLGLPVPKKAGQMVDGHVRVAVYILPDTQSTGMLEDLCLKALENHPLKPCVDEYIACTQTAQPLRQKNVPKATLNALLSCIEDNDNEVRLKFKYAVNQSWWPWDHPAFDDLKAFVRQVANVTG